jgi:hypothetical protein
MNQAKTEDFNVALLAIGIASSKFPSSGYMSAINRPVHQDWSSTALMALLKAVSKVKCKGISSFRSREYTELFRKQRISLGWRDGIEQFAGDVPR